MYHKLHGKRFDVESSTHQRRRHSCARNTRVCYWAWRTGRVHRLRWSHLGLPCVIKFDGFFCIKLTVLSKLDYYTAQGQKLGINRLSFSSGWPVSLGFLLLDVLYPQMVRSSFKCFMVPKISHEDSLKAPLIPQMWPGRRLNILYELIGKIAFWQSYLNNRKSVRFGLLSSHGAFTLLDLLEPTLSLSSLLYHADVL